MKWLLSNALVKGMKPGDKHEISCSSYQEYCSVRRYANKLKQLFKKEDGAGLEVMSVKDELKIYLTML